MPSTLSTPSTPSTPHTPSARATSTQPRRRRTAHVYRRLHRTRHAGAYRRPVLLTRRRPTRPAAAADHSPFGRDRTR